MSNLVLDLCLDGSDIEGITVHRVTFTDGEVWHFLTESNARNVGDEQMVDRGPYKYDSFTAYHYPLVPRITTSVSAL